MTIAAPRILFVPVSGAGGAGEFMRSLIIARGVRQRWPDAQVHFVVNTDAGYARDLEFPATLIQGSPTYNVVAVNQVIVRERPDIVVFDSSGRVAQYRMAKSVGAAVVYVSSRPKTRWKGLRLRRMRYVDQHWITQPRFLGGELTRWERCKLALMRRAEPVFLDVVFEPTDASRQQRLLASLNLQPQQYIAICIGSGGRYAQVQDPLPIVLSAAERVQRATGLTCVVVTGGNASAETAAADGVRLVRSLPNGELIDLLRGARVAVVNGGSLLLQAIANEVPAVALPVAGDQAERIRRCAALHVVLPAELDVQSIERAVGILANDANRRTAMRQASRALGAINGVGTALDALARLAAQRGPG